MQQQRIRNTPRQHLLHLLLSRIDPHPPQNAHQHSAKLHLAKLHPRTNPRAETPGEKFIGGSVGEPDFGIPFGRGRGCGSGRGGVNVVHRPGVEYDLRLWGEREYAAASRGRDIAWKRRVVVSTWKRWGGREKAESFELSKGQHPPPPSSWALFAYHNRLDPPQPWKNLPIIIREISEAGDFLIHPLLHLRIHGE
jgi:hypothetical protein